MASRYASLALLLLVLSASTVTAQEAGERLWAVDVQSVNVGSYTMIGQPRVAPDGTVYFVTDSLYAISPEGVILWKSEGVSSYVDVGADGTVYVSAGRAVIAYNPDGTERWRYTDTGSWGVTTGPTVGPDGNVYAVFIQGGLGVASFTPDGALRWNVPGFLTSDGPELGRVAFGPDNLYYADKGLWNVAGCQSPYVGLVSISLDGELEWCKSISGMREPPVGVEATLDGRAVIVQNALPNHFVQTYNPDGSLDWTQTFMPSSIRAGADGNLYAWHDISTLISLTADGTVRWAVPQPLRNFPWHAVVAPDGEAVVGGGNYGFGDNGTIIAADPADGHTLWSIPVTGPSAGVGAPAAFSPDGQVVYVPVNTLSLDVPDQLWAVRVHDERTTATPGEGEVLAPALTVAPNPAADRAAIALTLPAAEAATVAVYDALGRRVAVLHDGALAAGTHAFSLDASALPPGVYVLRATGDGLALTHRLVVR
ncbi:MAG TPA: PQQ-binding-like beta-propeller repeat protein [Rhodothermales bacterium]|nr:PQQ-binding-like beta-propeller repeat protein [Rhodothermales bacterium]